MIDKDAWFFSKSVEFLNLASRAGTLLPQDESDRFLAGLESIRGHVYLALGDQTCDPIAAFKQSLWLRHRAGEGPASIAEAEVDLAHALVRRGQGRLGVDMLSKAVGELEAAKGQGIAARAKLKLAECHLRRMQLAQAIQQVRESDAICELHRLQRRTADSRFGDVVIRLLRGAGRIQGNLRAVERPFGYEFV